MATLHIGLLGGFRLEEHAGGRIPLSSRKGALLLARLAVPPGTAHHREGLQLLLWPEADRMHAQGNLRYLLHKLRRTLPTACAPALVCTRGRVCLDAGLVAVDAERFERLVREGTAEALAAACGLYSGDLLAELPVHEPEFEDWLLPERARFRELARDAFWRHVQSTVWRGDVATAMRDGRRYLDIDPYCERMHQALIRLHLVLGERGLAARLFMRLKETLARDLQVEPGPEIAALVRRTIWKPGPARVPGRLDPAWVLGRDEAATTAEGTSLVAISTKPSIAVLPFEYRGGDPRPGYVADGLTEDIITDLSRFRSLFVTAGRSRFDGVDGGVDAKAIARDLGVRYVFEGTVRESAAVMRITGRLIDAATGGQIWAARYHRTLDEVLEHQDEISSGFVGNIAAQITANEVNRVRHLGLGHLRADDLGLRAYDRALFALNNHCEGARQEIMTLARQAISMDTGCRLGYAAIAEFHLLEAQFAWARSENDSLAKAQEAAEQIRIHDPGDHCAHLLLGRVALMRKQHDVALLNLRSALDLNPNDMRALCYLAWVEGSSGRPEVAKDHAEAALRLSPQNPDTRHFVFWNLAQVAFTTGDYRAGAMYAQQARQEMPRNVGDLGMLAACLAEAGESTQARAAIDEAMRLGPRYIRDRLRGHNYFKSNKDHDRYVGALRRAAGDLQF